MVQKIDGTEHFSEPYKELHNHQDSNTASPNKIRLDGRL